VRRSLRWLVLASVVFVAVGRAPAFAQMPDPKAMSGMPLPVGDLPAGTVTARVIRGQLSNPLEGQTVELTGAGAAKTAKTDKVGRATFTGLTPGSRVKISVTVGTERVESREFDVPAAGGVRVMLVATDANAPAQPGASAAAPQPAAPGTVAFGPETRFVVEMNDDALNVFNMMQISNHETRPVQTAGPIVFELPAGAAGAGMLDGSTQNASVAGGKVIVNGPFAPGNTVVQFAYSIPLGSESVVIAQKLPLRLPQLSVVAQRVGAMELASPQLAQQRQMSADGGTFIVAQGGALNAGDTVSLTLTGLPARPTWPRNVALALAIAIVAGGFWGASRRPRQHEPASRRNLHGSREKLLSDLAALETARRKGAIDADTYAARRETLVTALEDLYRGLDREVA
jgi:hypothetical protein